MLHKLLPFALSSLLLLASCTDSELNVSMSEDPGYAANPLTAIKAEDGAGRWTDGTIDHANHTVSFVFHALENLKEVNIRAHVEKVWGTMVSPKTPDFTLDLRDEQKITVNDGVDNIVYTVTGAIYQLVAGASATISGETSNASIAGSAINLKFKTIYSTAAFSSMDVDLKLNPGAELVAPSSLKGIDLSGQPLEVIIKDTGVGVEKKYSLSASTGDIINVSTGGWEDITTSCKTSYNLTLSPEIKLYRTGSLAGLAGNVGYAMTIPAGMVDMKVIAKESFDGISHRDSCKISPVVYGNKDYCIFLPLQGPGTLRPASSTARNYYSPLAFGPDRNGVKKVLRTDGLGGNIKMNSPALAVKDGKVSMAPAEADKSANRFTRFDDVKGTNPVDWSDADAAFGGYFQIVKEGTNLIGAEGDQGYSIYNSTGRKIQDLEVNLTPGWAWESILRHDALRIGRISVGCTSDGDLVLFSAEKFCNSHNNGQYLDWKHDGAPGDSRGVTLYELGQVMAGLGCSDAMTVEDYNWSYFVFQDGSSRGHDLFYTNNRWQFIGTESGHLNPPVRKPRSGEYQNMFVVAFK